MFADVRVAEEVLQDEPRVRGPLPDPPVGNDLLVRGHALSFKRLVSHPALRKFRVRRISTFSASLSVSWLKRRSCFAWNKNSSGP
jgi:hypothetical protein